MQEQAGGLRSQAPRAHTLVATLNKHHGISCLSGNTQILLCLQGISNQSSQIRLGVGELGIRSAKNQGKAANRE